MEKYIKEFALSLGADVCGIGSIDRFANAPTGFSPKDIFPECNANIQTINSIVPTNGTAVLTISAETMDLTVPLEEMLRRLRAFPGVIKAEVLAG